LTPDKDFPALDEVSLMLDVVSLRLDFRPLLPDRGSTISAGGARGGRVIFRFSQIIPAGELPAKRPWRQNFSARRKFFAAQNPV
jgi:hypothetical protein